MTTETPSKATPQPPKINEIVLMAGLMLLALITLLPFALVFFGSFKSQGEFMANPGGWLPESFFHFDNYVYLFAEAGFGTYLINSVLVSAIVLFANILFGSMTGYALAKLSFPGKRLVMIAVLIGITMPVVAIAVPQFLIASQLGLVNTIAGIVAPWLALPLSVFVMRQFAYSIPDELLEAARMDGVGEAGIFFRIVLPLMGPGMATVAILSFLHSWNNFLWPLLIAQSPDSFTMPIALALASAGSNITEYGVLLAGAVIILLPVLLLFVMLQRYFIQGIAASGMK